MVCIYCGLKTSVINSRLQKRQNHIWRRRQCISCMAVFTTSEAPDLYKGLAIESDGDIKPFSRDKLFVSVHDSLKHRKTATEDAMHLTDTIISKILPSVQKAQITKNNLSELAFNVLLHFDKSASVYYKSYHLS